MSSWVLLRPFPLKDCLSFVLQPFKQAQKPNISLAFSKHRKQAQKGFTDERCEPTVANGAKNHRSIRSDSEESLWRLTGPDIPLWILKPFICRGFISHYMIQSRGGKNNVVIVLTAVEVVVSGVTFIKALNLSGNSGVFAWTTHLQPYCSLLRSAHCKQFYLLHLLFTLCRAVWVGLKGCLGQQLLSKTQEITFKINKTVVSGVVNPKIPLRFTFLLFIHEHHRVLTFQIYKNIAHSWMH